MAYVYQHIRNDTNEIFYIGIGSDTNGTYRRANTKKGRNEHWHNVVNKAGYKVEILTDCITKELASDEEKRLIKLYGRKNNNTGILVNMTDGGEGTTGRFYGPAWNKGKTNIYSEEIREKIRQANRDRIYTPETRRKLSEAKKGIKHKMKTNWLQNESNKPLVPNTELGPIDYLLAYLIDEKVKAGVGVEYWNDITSGYNGGYTQKSRLRSKIKYFIKLSQNQIHKSSDTLDK